MKIKEIINKVESSELFKQWEEKDKAKLTHLFNGIDNHKLDNWQLGYYNKETDKITVFEVGDKIEKLPSDDVLKKSQDIPALNQDIIKIDFLDSIDKAKEFKANKYPKLITNKTIIILQKLEVGQVWNLTFVGHTLDVLNIKVDSNSGEIVEDSLKPLFSFDKGKS